MCDQCHPLWLRKCREMLGVFMLVWVVGNVLGSWPGHPPRPTAMDFQRISLMSNFGAMTKHPETGKIEPATWWDDYFGRHQYGVEFPDGKVFCPEKHDIHPERKPIPCETCGGRGEIGGFLNAENGYHSEPCTECVEGK